MILPAIKLNLKTAKEIRLYDIKTKKICLDCNEIKLLKDFKVYKSSPNSISVRCKDCYKTHKLEYQKNLYHTDGQNAKRDYQFRRKYGVSLEHVTKTLESQQNRCANEACRREITISSPKDTVKQAVVDHDHSTGKFRAVLCHGCNLLLGKLEKDLARVRGLEQYLNKHTYQT